jgi:hypothetical protein
MLRNKKSEMEFHQKVEAGFQQQLVSRRDSGKQSHEHLAEFCQVDPE